ncbi:MAG: hypothetical protein JW829_15395 [Pirellulales bacterium]|nr:hypothetical protein [Pirellulales bacterium]
MPRRIRLFEKKRGKRRTGPPWAGHIGEAVFYAFFLIVGLIGSTYLITSFILPELRANQYCIESTCRVLNKRLGRQVQLGELRYRPEIQIEYKVHDRTEAESTWTYDAANRYQFNQSDAEAILDQFQVGKSYRCWYDPLNPAYVVLIRYHWLPWGILIVAILFAIFGGAGLAYSWIHSRTSPERRLSPPAARTPKESAHAHARHPKPEPITYPAVPSVDNIINSPGTQLAYRLPIDAYPGWRLFGIGSAAALWNAVVGLLIYHLISRFRVGLPSLLWTATLVPFVVVGIGLIIAWIRQLLLTTSVSVTRVEVEDHPFRPGETYEISLTQTGRMKINLLEVLLICDERATYHQGTDIRRATERVFEQIVFQKDQFEIGPGETHEEHFELIVPSQAMHSLSANHNEVLWALMVRGKVHHLPDFERRFPICVYPPAPSTGIMPFSQSSPPAVSRPNA